MLKVTVIVLLVCCGVLFVTLIKSYEGFSLRTIRTFYHNSRMAGGIGIFFGLAGIIGPIILVVGFINKKYSYVALSVACLLLIGKKAPFFYAIVACLFYFRLFDKFKFKSLAPVLVAVGLLLTLQQASSSSSLPPLKIFSGYFNYYPSAAEVVFHKDKMGTALTPGSIYVSRLWKTLPRMIYPEKPEVYGYNLIHQEVFPRELEIGYTPGIVSPITVPYFEFGFLGVIIYGLITGFGSAIFVYITNRCQSYFLSIYGLLLALSGVTLNGLIVGFFLFGLAQLHHSLRRVLLVRGRH